MAIQTAEQGPATEEVPRAKASLTKPPGAKKTEERINAQRRRLTRALIGGYLGINFLMFLRFFFPRALYEPSTIVNIGYPSDFQSGVNQQFLQSNRIWVVLEPGRLFVIFARCTHLGCTPDWLPQQNMFHCPCHGSDTIGRRELRRPAPPVDLRSLVIKAPHWLMPARGSCM